MIIGSLNNPKFDSEISANMVNATTNAELTLFLRVCLVQVAGGGTIQDANGTPFQVRAWTPAGWHWFTSRYQEQAQRYWGGKFWLETPNDFGDLDWPERSPTHRANVWCRLRLSVVPTPAQAHKTIKVAHLVGQNLSSSTFRSHDSLYDNFDLGQSAYVRNNRVYYQRTFIHEVGHALGLPHIGVMTAEPTCPAVNTNADQCYGVLPADRRNIMGFGSQLTANDALPWRKRIAEHTGTRESNWRVSLHRLYPRTLGSFAGMSVNR
jgi:hypothetical protein